MMLNNKSGLMSKIILPLFLFFFVASIFTFFLMFAQEGVGTPLIDEMTTQVNSVATKVMDDPGQVINNSLSLQSDYELAKFNYDWVFMLVFFLFEVGLIELAIISPKLPSWNYLTWLFFGTSMLSLGFSWMLDASSWFVNNFIFGGLFPPEVTYLPFYSWVLGFQLIIFIVNIVGVLLINQLFGKQGIIDTKGILGGLN